MKLKLVLLFFFFSVNLIYAESQILSEEDFALAIGENNNAVTTGQIQNNNDLGVEIQTGNGVVGRGNKNASQRFVSNVELKKFYETGSNILKFAMKNYNPLRKKEWFAQSISVNETSKINLDSNSFVVSQEAIGEWAENGGGFGHPSYFWACTDKEREKIVNNVDNYAMSTYFKYLLVCEIKSSKIKNLPSYIFVKSKTEVCNEVEYQFALLEPKDEEVTIEIEQVADCQFYAKSNGGVENLYPTNVNLEVVTKYEGKINPLSGGQRDVGSSDPNNRVFTNKITFDTKDLPIEKPSQTLSAVGGVIDQFNNLSLKSLIVDGCDLKPEFISNYFYYQTDLKSATDGSVPVIIAVAQDSINNIVIDKPINIYSERQNERTAYINVISADKKAKKTYSVIFDYKREKNYLLSLESSLGPLLPEFNKFITNYQIDLSKSKELLIDNKSIQNILNSISVISEDVTDRITLTPIQFENNNFLTVAIDLQSVNNLKFNQYFLTFFANEKMWHI